MNDRAQLSDMIGVTMASVTVSDDKERVTFTAEDGREWQLYHSQDCCESVQVEDVAGDLADLAGSPLTMADEASFENETPIGHNPPRNSDSYTWTFYRFATLKGYVTIRFLGESNGCYSESVDFAQTSAPAPTPEGTRDA